MLLCFVSETPGKAGKRGNIETETKRSSTTGKQLKVKGFVVASTILIKGHSYFNFPKKKYIYKNM